MRGKPLGFSPRKDSASTGFILARSHRKVGRVAERIANVRKDWQHKTTTTIVRENQVIAMEDLNVAEMSASAKGAAAAPGKQAKQKAGLSRAVLNVGLGELRRQITYKVSTLLTSSPP